MTLNIYCVTLERGTIDMDLFYSKESKSSLFRYADVDYLSDSHKARSLVGFFFVFFFIFYFL